MLQPKVNRISPYRVIIVSLLCSLAIFLLLDQLEQIALNSGVQFNLRIWHFVRGFLTCFAGMIFVWWIMDRKEMELVKWRDHFAEELSYRTKELENALAEREKDISEQVRLQTALLQQRDDIVAVIKHRLQINIVASQRVVGLLMDNGFASLGPEQLNVVRALSDTIDDTYNVLDMLVDVYLFKNSRKLLHSNSLNLALLVSTVVQTLEPICKGKKIQVTESVPDLFILGDQKELERMLRHLLLNAIKFAKGHIQVASKQEGTSYQVIISDDGPGLSEKDIPRLFDRFFQETASGKYMPFTGIGLCLCSEIARAHGGEITCISNPGSGTKFIVTLLAQQPAALHCNAL